MSRSAIYPGSFDPITYGHIDLIKRASHVFGEVIVSVALNQHKEMLFSCEERVAMIKESIEGIDHVQVESFDGLVINYARRKKIYTLIRGLRMISDFEYELQMALTNRRLAGDVETVFLMPSEGCSFLSSTLIKEVASLGADVSSFVTEAVAKRLVKKLTPKKS